MTTVHTYVDEEVSDLERRLSLFTGDLFVYSPRDSSLALGAAAHQVVEQTLGAEPARAQVRLSEAEFTVLYRAAVRGVQHTLPALAAGLVADMGCDPATTFMGPPTLVVTTGAGYLAHGLGAPQHPHRDTWYAASPSQVNWSVPLYDLDAGAAVAFHPHYFDVALVNSSDAFDYEEWQVARRSGRSGGPAHPLTQPRPLQPIDLAPEIRIRCPVGAVMIWSAAHLCSTVPNETLTSRFSVRFQTVCQVDLEGGVGAANLDADPQGTSLEGFVRCSDGGPMPPALVRRDLEQRLRP
ncbi:MAG: hypothetical protein ACRDZR_08325 [Acidimicrobiales bacterium]